MKKYQRLTALSLAAVLVLCLLSGCAGEMNGPAEDVPVLTVYIPSDLEDSCTMQALNDTAFLRRIEETLGYRLVLHMLPAGMDYNEVALLDFTGILLSDDPAWVVPLAENRKLQTLTAQMENAEYGQYNNSLYGYVLDDPNCASESIIVLANLEALNKVGSTQIPYTPDAVHALLEQLKQNYRVPLAVSGMPTDAGFAPLLALFGIAPSGGREMYVEGSEVVYDKLSDAAGEYLRYIQTLYAEGLIPSDALELTEFSCAKMIAQNAAAMAVFTEDTYVNLALDYAKEQNRQLVCIEIPVKEQQLQTGIFSRMVGYVSKNSITDQEATVFFELLQQRIDLCSADEQKANVDKIGQYSLFRHYDTAQIRQDPREICPMYVYWLYQKEYLDMTYLDGIYCKILLGEADVLELRTSSDAWLADSGLLNLIAGKYWAQTHKNG